MSAWYSRVSVSTSISTHPMFCQSINTQTHHINTPHLHGCPVSPFITCTIQSQSHLSWLSLTLLSLIHIPSTYSSSFTCVSIHLIPPHTIMNMFSCPFSSTIRSAQHSFSLSHPSHHKQGLEGLSKLIVSDGMFLSFKNHTSFSFPFPPSFSLVFSLFCLSVPHFNVNTFPFPLLPQSVVCF